jgi:regulatory protein YycH of two-component signal transduction system YycFG
MKKEIIADALVLITAYIVMTLLVSFIIWKFFDIVVSRNMIDYYEAIMSTITIGAIVSYIKYMWKRG